MDSQLKKDRFDDNGEACTLESLCRSDPEWAASRIRCMEDALTNIQTWVEGYENPVTSMGAGLHAEKWPSLSPSARRRLLEILRAERFSDKEGE